MNKGYWLLGASLLFISTSISLPAYAGNTPGAVTVTLGDGFERFSSKRHFENTGVAFGALGYNFNQHWGVEGLLGFFTTKSHHLMDGRKEVNGSTFAVDAVYRFSPYRMIEPYVLAGPGISSMNPNGNNPHTQGNINGAVGTQIFISDMIAFRFEARDFYTIVGGFNDALLSGAVSFVF